MAAPMINSMLSARNLVGKTYFVPQVRWYRPRKPMWKGRAKSKMFNVPKIEVLPEEERIEIQRLEYWYRTTFKSIRHYCAQEYYLKTTGNTDTSLSLKRQQEDEEDFARMLEENRLQNEQTTLMREERVKAEAERLDNRLVERILKLADREKDEIEKANEEIRRKKELVKTLITPENIDAMIEHALANPVDFNFAIGLDGSVLKADQSLPQETREKAVSKQ